MRVYLPYPCVSETLIGIIREETGIQYPLDAWKFLEPRVVNHFRNRKAGFTADTSAMIKLRYIDIEDMP